VHKADFILKQKAEESSDMPLADAWSKQVLKPRIG
jgi:hypothetical protein